MKRVALLLVALISDLALASPSSSPSVSPTTLRPTISPSGPTPSPSLPSLNFADKNAFLQMSANLNRGSWVDCHLDTDACSVCSENTADHAVECEEVAIPGQAGRFERRIVGLRFRNLNIKGTVDEFVLTSFTALKVVDLSNNRSKPYVNRIMPEFGEECVRLSFCYDEDKFCDFGPIAPLCSTNVSANASSPQDDSSIGMYIGIAFGVLGFIVLVTVGFLYYSQKKSKKRNRQEQKARNRKRKKMMEQQQDDDVQTVFSQQSAYTNASSTGSVRMKPAERVAKSFSSIRTRQKKAESSAQEWVQQIDPATGGPYWMHMNTGAIRYEPPGLDRKQSSKSLKKAGSMKKTGSSKKLVRGGSSKGKGLKPKSSTMEMAVPGMTGPPMPPPMMGGGGPPPPPPGMAPSGPWEQTFDSTTNSTYWVNSATGQFSWTQPTM